jgi:hypothetical protein
MMGWRARVAAGLLVLVSAAGEVMAGPCADEIAALDRQIEETARAAISTSTGSKEIAAAREGRAVEARDRDTSVTALPNAPAPGTPEAQATEKAAEAGAGGDRVMRAKASLNRARTLDAEGNGTCHEALLEARGQLDN